MTDSAWSDSIDSWLAVLVAAGRPRTTRNLRAYQLRRFAAEICCEPWDIDGDALVDWIGSHEWAAETLRSWRAAFRGFYGWAWRTKRIADDPSIALPAVKPAAPNPRPTPHTAYRSALRHADDRVTLMLRLAAELGMRRGEVARAHHDDLERDLYGWTMVVHGKGGKIRRVPVPDGLAAAVRRHIGYLFPGQIHGHLSPAWVGRLVSRELPGVWSMHSLRHKFGTVAFEHEHDLLAVQLLLGHSSVETTRRYVLRPSESLRRTVIAVGIAS